MNNEDNAIDPEKIAASHRLVHQHLTESVAHEEYIQTVEFDASIPRWYVRFGCDGRDATTIYFDFHQRSLHYEVYFLPAPAFHHSEICDLLLRANNDSYGVAACIAPDGEIYLKGRRLLAHVDEAELDRIIGSIYMFTERWFPRVVKLAFTA